MPPNHGEYNLRRTLCGESSLLQVGTGVAHPELATPWVHSGTSQAWDSSGGNTEAVL